MTQSTEELEERCRQWMAYAAVLEGKVQELARGLRKVREIGHECHHVASAYEVRIDANARPPRIPPNECDRVTCTETGKILRAVGMPPPS